MSLIATYGTGNWDVDGTEYIHIEHYKHSFFTIHTNYPHYENGPRVDNQAKPPVTFVLSHIMHLEISGGCAPLPDRLLFYLKHWFGSQMSNKIRRNNVSINLPYKTKNWDNSVHDKNPPLYRQNTRTHNAKYQVIAHREDCSCEQPSLMKSTPKYVFWHWISICIHREIAERYDDDKLIAS